MRLSVWRKIRLCVRWLRRTALAAVIILITALLWFNQIGLPDFAKKSLIEKVRAHGIDLDFVRLRLHFTGGLVAENVRIGGAHNADVPTVALAAVQLQPDLRALLHGQLQLEGVALREGRIVWRYSPTNLLSVENINTELRFGTNDTWSLDNFKANFAGARFALSGNITHASEMRGWDIFHRKKTGGMAWRTQLQRVSDAVVRIRPHPQLTLVVSGDGHDINSFFVNLTVMQGRTKIQLDGHENDLTDEFQWRVHGALEPEIIRPFLYTTNALRAFDHLAFNEPVFVDANVSGRIDQPDSISAAGAVAATNFTIRGERADYCSGDFTYTNRVLEFLTPQMGRGEQKMTADKVILNLDRRVLWIINGFSTADPHSVARAIGKKTAHFLEPYHFDPPPTVRVNGSTPIHEIDRMHDADDADLTFDIISGRNFQCLKIRGQNVTGTIHWAADKLILTNIVAQLYGGSGNGYAYFDFGADHEGADYQFAANVANVNLHLAAQDLLPTKKNLDGWLSGKVVVTHGDTRDWRAMDGYGHAELHNGLLWDEPIFGNILSPVINALVPGMQLGNNRATDAEGHFSMTNGLVYSRSLEIHSAMVRLQYDGSVNLNGNVSAHVIAQPLADMWGIGHIIDIITYPFSKLFEYRISGTLKDPVLSPMHVPKELMPGRSGRKKSSTEEPAEVTNPSSSDMETNLPAIDLPAPTEIPATNAPEMSSTNPPPADATTNVPPQN